MIALEKLPARVRRVIDRCGGGQTLCIAFQSREIGPPVCWFEPSGSKAASLSAIEATRSGHLVATGSSLFGDVPAQTWRAR